MEVTQAADQLNDDRVWNTNDVHKLNISPIEHPVRFEIARDAGELHLTGHMQGLQGDGTFEFVPSPQYAKELATLGLAIASDIEQLALAVYDVSLKFVHEVSALQLAGLTPGQLIAFRVHGVTVALIEQLRAAGQSMNDTGTVIAFRVQGITPELVDAFHQEGCAPRDSTLISMKTSDVTPAWIHDLRQFGYECGNADPFVALHSLGVTPDFISLLKQLGIRPTLAQLVAMRGVGVTSEYVLKLRARGERNLRAEDLIRLRAAED